MNKYGSVNRVQSIEEMKSPKVGGNRIWIIVLFNAKVQ